MYIHLQIRFFFLHQYYFFSDKLYRPDEVPKPDLPIPASMKIRWCRWYLQRRLGEKNVTEESLTAFYNQTRIYDIVRPINL